MYKRLKKKVKLLTIFLVTGAYELTQASKFRDFVILS